MHEAGGTWSVERKTEEKGKKRELLHLISGGCNPVNDV